MKKLLFIVIDGAADTPVEELEGRTPLDVADTSNIDRLSKKGKNGLMQVLPIPPESDEAVLSLLGFDVFKVYTGRGPLEAVGAGIPFKNGDLALRCNFATIQDSDITDIRAGFIQTHEAKQLEEAIAEFVDLGDVDFIFKSTKGYRGVLVIKSAKKLSPKITNSHPGYYLRFFEPVWSKYGASKAIPLSEAVPGPEMKVMEVKPTDNTAEAAYSAKLVNEFIKKSSMVLEKHPTNIARAIDGLSPANVILTRDAGNRIPQLYDFSTVYGVKWASFADMPVERGIAQLCGMDVLPIPELTGDAEKDMKIRLLTLQRNYYSYDAFYIHLKGPDPYAHVGDVKGKIKSIEEIDKYFFRPLLETVDMNNTIIVVTCDHTTSCEHKAHTADPVPLVISGAGVDMDKTEKFSEKDCARGNLGKIAAINLIPYLMKLIKI